MAKLPNIPLSPRANLDALHGDVLYAETVIFDLLKKYRAITGSEDRKRLNDALKGAHRVRVFIAAQMRWRDNLKKWVDEYEKQDRLQRIRRFRKKAKR